MYVFMYVYIYARAWTDFIDIRFQMFTHPRSVTNASEYSSPKNVGPTDRLKTTHYRFYQNDFNDLHYI
jgi:hypothetical protein